LERYLIIIGGETEVFDDELELMKQEKKDRKDLKKQ
jgi:hypothetical protein